MGSVNASTVTAVGGSTGFEATGTAANDISVACSAISVLNSLQMVR